MLNFALSLILNGGKKCTFHLYNFKSAHLIKNDSLTSEEKTVVIALFVLDDGPVSPQYNGLMQELVHTYYE